MLTERYSAMRLFKNLITLMLLGITAICAQAQDDELLKQSRNLSLSMLKELGAKLQSSMAEGGAINAITAIQTKSTLKSKPSSASFTRMTKPSITKRVSYAARWF